MKNPNYVNAIFFFLLASVMMSCQKETMITNELENKTETSDDILDSNGTSADLGKVYDEFSSVVELGTVTFDVSISVTNCTGGDGVTLTVMNPESNDPNFFSNAGYQVVWTRNNLEEVYAEGTSISCVCSSGFRVTVTDSSGTVKSTSVDTPPC